MKNSSEPSGEQREKIKPDPLQGEGDYRSATTYGKSVRSFAQSGKVAAAAKNAKPTTPQEQQELLQAERTGLSHSKGEDPASPLSPARTPGG